MTDLSKSDILEFIKDSPSPVTKREIAAAFKVRGGQERIKLKSLLKELVKDGVITKQPGQVYSIPQGLPGVTIIEVSDIDIDGDVFARLPEWSEALQGPPPRIEVMPKAGHPALGIGDRALVKLTRLEKDIYQATPIRKLDTEKGRVMGEIKIGKRGAFLAPTDKKAKYNFDVQQHHLGAARHGDIVIGDIIAQRGVRNKCARVVQVIGRRDDPKAISLISIYESGLREDFPERVLKETKGLKVPELKKREDMRDIPLVTIDGADARDFDDAVFAQKTKDGYHLIVAIADVAHYVRDGSDLNTEALRRGNSTYFPDRVVPMLPEALSNDLCSLRPKETRASLAVHMHIDNLGNLTSYKFVRALIRSAARLTYEQVQAAKDGIIDDTTDGLMEQVITPLYEAFAILDKARAKRGALALDLPEHQILLDKKGNMSGVTTRARLDSHKLIEEFMVLANVASAMALEDKKAPCIYRIHDAPSQEKIDSAREFIENFELTLPKGQRLKPAQINSVLEKAAKLPYSHLISIIILRCQSRAIYSPENIGHFGLALSRYAHFTSPIRRYADLVVHRSLIRAYGLGDGGLSEREEVQIEQICEDISQTERTSMEAERSATDRFTASFLSQQIGAEFTGQISGVTRFGLFVHLDESGADGIVPMRSLPDDYYIHDEQAHALIGRKSRRIYRLGAPVTVKLMEADGLTGSTVLNLVGHEKGADIPGVTFKQKKTDGYRGDKRGGKSHKKGKFSKKRGGKRHKR